MGPYLIQDITTSAAFCLSTLDSEKMTNLLRKYRVKKYHEPLMTEMIQRLHDVQARWQQSYRENQVAIQEGKEQAQKLKPKVIAGDDWRPRIQEKLSQLTIDGPCIC